jgi:hypothetical protein
VRALKCCKDHSNLFCSGALSPYTFIAACVRASVPVVRDSRKTINTLLLQLYELGILASSDSELVCKYESTDIC